MPKLSPGIAYYTVTTAEDAAGLGGLCPVTRPGDITAGADLIAVHVADRAARVTDLSEDRYDDVAALIAAYPELTGTRTLPDGYGGSVVLPIVLRHTYHL